MFKEIITASIGICKDHHGNYYLQIITAENQFCYFVQIDEEQANELSLDEGLVINSSISVPL